MSGDNLEGKGIEVTIEDNRANIMFDMSSWDLFETCKARYNMKHNMNKGVPAHKKNKALDLGGVIHEGMDAYYQALKEEKHYSDRVHAALLRARASACSEESNLTPEELNLVIRTIEENTDFWRHEDEFLRILEVERAFAYELYSDEYIRIIITGKIDLLVDYLDYSGKLKYERLPIDHKTFSRDFETTRLTNQFQNYCNATGSNYLLVNKIGLQKTLKAEEKFKRIPLSYDPLILEDWKNNLISGVLDEYLHCVANNKWRMNLTSCYKYNRKCEFYDICDTSGESNKIYKLTKDYETVKPWDVTAGFNKDSA